MELLNKYKKSYTNNDIQFVFVNDSRVILESDQAFLKLTIGDFIYNTHPFFECLHALENTPEEETTFNCVHLNIHDKEYTTDIKIIKKIDGILLVLHNLTQHYLTYQSIAQSRNESIINGELIILKNSELEERERFKNSFIQNFSHELRNPLTNIISITNIIANTELTGEQKNMINFLRESNANLKLMLEDILSISMIASGKLQLRNKEFNIYELFNLLRFTYGAKAKEKGLEFTLTSDIKIPEYVEGDYLRIYQILTNLLDNAFKYTQDGSINFNIELNQKRANKVSLRFKISDTGIGIPQEKLATVFNSFTQLKTAEQQNGNGLGLAIVKGLLQQMESDIKVHSKLNRGSTFYFDIVLKYPLHPTIKPDIKEKKYKHKEEGKFKVLLVEDDIHLQTTLFKILINTEVFFVDLINDGAKVIEELVNNSYDIILMDINLPNLSGDKITHAIREFPFKNIKKIPIIGLTANAYEDDIKAYLKAGMNAVVPKPFDHDVLLKTMFKYLK